MSGARITAGAANQTHLARGTHGRMVASTMLSALMHASLSVRNERFRSPADTHSRGRSLTVATVDLEDYWCA